MQASPSAAAPRWHPVSLSGENRRHFRQKYDGGGPRRILGRNPHEYDESNNRPVKTGLARGSQGRAGQKDRGAKEMKDSFPQAPTKQVMMTPRSPSTAPPPPSKHSRSSWTKPALQPLPIALRPLYPPD
ncbi:hypothetical protein HL42_3581 [Trichophyton rubrum]|nr:hypothetical protein HL42_3581 [Trichophyton rubrum]